MAFCDDFSNNMHLLPDVKEDTDYMIVNDKTFQLLYGLYGGTDIRKVPIQIETTFEKKEEIIKEDEEGPSECKFGIDLNINDIESSSS